MTIEVKGAKIHFIDRGAGQPVLMLHGNPDSSEMWLPMIEKLHLNYRCIAPDLPGFGKSDIIEDFTCSLNECADFVNRFVDVLNIQTPLNLIGHDFGGIFGLAWAIRFPHRVRRIVVGSCPFFSDYKWHFWAKVWRTPMLGELSMLAMNPWLFRWEVKKGAQKMPDEKIEQTYQKITPKMKKMVLRLYRATNPENFKKWEPHLPQLTKEVSMLIFWGEKDPYIPARYADRFGTAEVVRLTNCGHWFPLEEVNLVAEKTLAFFAD